MRKLFWLIVICVLTISAAVIEVRSAVVINEVCVGCIPQAVEIYNTASSAADISGWYLDDAGGSTYITIGAALLQPSRCYVIEGDFNFNRSSPDSIRLFTSFSPPTSSSAILVDVYSYKITHPEGSTYSRIPDGQIWATAAASLGLYNIEKISCLMVPTPSSTTQPTLTTLPDPTLIPLPATISYTNIYISELMPYPNTNEPEWIEFYNDNDFTATLNGWYIDDIQSAGSAPKKINVEIDSHGYKALDLSSSMFNNDGDTARLLNPDQQEIDAIEYGSTPQNSTFQRITFQEPDMCRSTITKNAPNQPCITPISLPVSFQSTTPQAKSMSRDSRPTVLPVNDRNSSSFFPLPLPGSILGTRIEKNHSPQNAYNPKGHLAFLSITYSSLSFWSLLLKLKRAFFPV